MTISEVDKKIISNKSKTYLLPLLSKDISIEFEYLIINTYVKFNKDIGCIENPIGILYEYEHTESFVDYMDYLDSHPLFFRSFPLGKFILYIFYFPKQYMNEYYFFKEGKYSKFSTDAKSLIVSYSTEAYKYPPLIEDLVGVLWKHKSRREKMERALGLSLPKDSELASKIIFDNETFYFKE
jgi:hypothetical protein